MNQEKAQIIFLASLRTQNITKEMLVDYLNKSFNEEEVGIPEDYFYAFMREALKRTMKITMDMLDEDISDSIHEIKELLTDSLGQNVDIYAQ